MTTYRISDYKIKLNCIVFIQNLDIDKEWLVTIKPYKKQRSVSQNCLLWLWYGNILRHIYESKGELYSPDDIHEWMKIPRLQPELVSIEGEAVRVRKSTKKLNTKEFTEYLENIDHYCGANWGLQLPHPDDLFHEAMGR